jgi:hypothetical protein
MQWIACKVVATSNGQCFKLFFIIIESVVPTLNLTHMYRAASALANQLAPLELTHLVTVIADSSGVWDVARALQKWQIIRIFKK